MTGAVAVLISGMTFGQIADAAFAADYPSWADVQAARSSVAAKQAEISRLDGLLASLESAVGTAQALAKQKGAEYSVAQQKFDDAQYKSMQTQKQADAAKAKAAESKQQAGKVAARLARAGGGNLDSTLFFDGENAKDLLSQLGLASLVQDKSSGIYQKATRDQNTAQSMTNQANVAKAALKKLLESAQTALADATAASQRAADAVAEQEVNRSRLEAQRASLVGDQAQTEAGYNAGVQAAAAKKAAEEKAAADWAAAHPAPPSSGGGGGGGAPSSSGWVRPSGGHISSGYGTRVNPVDGGVRLHAGTDLAAGCNAPIVAASEGTVIFAGWSGGYGNFIIINHGGGLSTGYGHIVNGGTLVGVGQHVSAGQQIARVGSTGNSTGCHLHFETRPGGVAVDAVPFMRARGVQLG
jgi:murein DD-endopeptidase MepM/ murein hydrolase activator NlpD